MITFWLGSWESLRFQGTATPGHRVGTGLGEVEQETGQIGAGPFRRGSEQVEAIHRRWREEDARREEGVTL